MQLKLLLFRLTLLVLSLSVVCEYALSGRFSHGGICGGMKKKAAERNIWTHEKA